VEALFLDRTWTVLVSSFAEFPAGTLLPREQLLSVLAAGEGDYLFQVDPSFGTRRKSMGPRRSMSGTSREDDGQAFILVTRVHKQLLRPPDRLPWMQIMGAALVALFLFCAIVLTAIVRSISRSVTLLDQATGRIAAGDLDTTIDVRGSNEISSLSHSLNAMQKSLKESQHRRSRFIMGVSHDLRTPLALIKGYTEALADGVAETAEMRHKSLDIIRAKIEQLQDLIDGLIDAASLDSGKWRNTLGKKPLFPILSAYAARLAADGNLLHRTVTSGIHIPETLEIPLDERMLIRMLENIAGNALRYTAEGGSIHLAAEWRDGEIAITIADDGCGIAKVDLPYIFDPFYRGSNSRREDGRGFGLSVVKSVADSHGWKVDVRSEEGHGSVFTVRIQLRTGD
jgi:signal transduction histidine kinase